jgi:transcriptional regulator GlxA family with amidase domain
MLNAISDLSGPTLWPPRSSPRPSLADVARYIEANFSERIALKDLASVAELSVFRLVTVFRREMGISPYRYLNAVRVKKAQQLLRDGVPPAIAAIEVGFFDQSHLCWHFRTICGMTPGQFLANPASSETLT